MSIRRRVGRLERTLGNDPSHVLPVILDGNDDDAWRPRVEAARRNGHAIRIIRFSLQDEADTVEEAEAIIARHREKHGRTAAEVFRRGTRGEELLAEFDPGLPEWLRQDAEPSDRITIR